MKKMLSLFLVLTLLFAFVPTVYATDTELSREHPMPNFNPVANDDVLQVNEDAVLSFDKTALLGNDLTFSFDGMDDSIALAQLSASAPELSFERDFQNPLVLRIVEVTSTTLGALVWEGALEGTPEFTYTPNENVNGNDTFRYKIEQGMMIFERWFKVGECQWATVTVEINPLNDAPVAQDDPSVMVQSSEPMDSKIWCRGEFSTLEDTKLVLNLELMISNDSDIDGDEVYIDEVMDTETEHGKITSTKEEGVVTTIEYMPDPNYYGTDVFDYQINDGHEGTDSARVTITVCPVNDVPVAVDDSATTLINTPVTIPVLQNDFDVEDDEFGIYGFDEVSEYNGSITAAALIMPIELSSPSGGMLKRFGDELIYTPATGFTGVDTFEYVIAEMVDPLPQIVVEGIESCLGFRTVTDSAIVTVTVNPLPIPPTPTPTPTPPTPTMYNVSVAQTGLGTVILGNFYVQAGDFIIGTITPAAGWELGSIAGANGGEVTQIGDAYRISVNAAKEIIVNFVEIPIVVPEIVVPETVVPETLPVETVVENMTSTPSEVVLNVEQIPEAGLPATGGLPLGMLFSIGSIVTVLGTIVRHKNKD